MHIESTDWSGLWDASDFSETNLMLRYNHPVTHRTGNACPIPEAASDSSMCSTYMMVPNDIL